jgi:hypothetical protein
VARVRPSYSGWLPDPMTYAPPCTQIITGLYASLESVSDVAQIFSVRQSSPFGARRFGQVCQPGAGTSPPAASSRSAGTPRTPRNHQAQPGSRDRSAGSNSPRRPGCRKSGRPLGPRLDRPDRLFGPSSM